MPGEVGYPEKPVVVAAPALIYGGSAMRALGELARRVGKCWLWW